MASNVIVARTPQPCQAGAARSGRRKGLGAGAKSDLSQTAGGRIGNLGQAIYQPWPAGCPGRLGASPAQTTSVIDAITRRAEKAGLPVLILKIPNNPILQSCALPDYNCGATLISAKDCAYTFSSSISHYCRADEDAHV
jgi:hypothetical protein